MGFFGIGTWEILLVLIVALIIWGPGKLPEIARKLGQTVRALRKASSDLTAAVTKELDITKDLDIKEKAPPPDSKPASTGHKNTQPKKPKGQRQQNE